MNSKKRPLTAKSTHRQQAQPSQPPKPKPEWNTEINENPFKITRAEALQRKLNAKSKNQEAAKEELQAKLEQLKSGKVPKEYKEYTQKGVKKFSAKEAFIKDKDLFKEYEGRSWVSKEKELERQQQEQAYKQTMQQDIEDEIIVKRETTQVKTTFASMKPPMQEQAVEVQRPDFSSCQIEFKHTNSVMSEQLPTSDNRYQFQINFSNGLNQAPEEAQLDSGYDYLDYKENEAKLEQLRNQNMSLYSHLSKPSTVNPQQYSKGFQEINSYQPPIQQETDDLDNCFKNLNLMLGGGKTGGAASTYGESSCQITPIKYSQSQASGLDSPKSLLPNYAELLSGLQPSKPHPVFDYSRAPLSNDYEPNFTQQKVLLNPDQVLNRVTVSLKNSSQPPQSYQSNLTSYSYQPQLSQQQMQYNQKAPQFQSISLPEEEPAFALQQAMDQEDKEMARMREMLMSTQQEIDKIIQGSSNVADIYNSSKASLVSNKPISAYGGQITVSQPLREVSLANGNQNHYYFNQALSENSNILNTQPSTHPSQSQMSRSNLDEDLKPRSYPYQSMPLKNHALNPPHQNYAYNENSISLRANIQGGWQ